MKTRKLVITEEILPDDILEEFLEDIRKAAVRGKDIRIVICNKPYDMRVLDAEALE